MDISTSLGQQLLETLSQGSGSTRNSRTSRTSRGGGGGGGGGTSTRSNSGDAGAEGSAANTERPPAAAAAQTGRESNLSISMSRQQRQPQQSALAGGADPPSRAGSSNNGAVAKQRAGSRGRGGGGGHLPQQQNPHQQVNNSSQHQQSIHNSSYAGRSHMSVASSKGASQASTALSHVDEAYRRLGHRLSIQAHGDDPSIASKPPAIVRIRYLETSGFNRYRPPSEESDSMSAGVGGGDSSLAGDGSSSHVAARISKVPKTKYSDHGEHGLSSQRSGSALPNSLLKTLTCQAKEQFRKWQDAEPSHPKLSSGSSSYKAMSAASSEVAESSSSAQPGGGDQPSIDPQHYAAFSQLDLEGPGQGRQAPAAAAEDGYSPSEGELGGSSSWRHHQRHHHHHHQGGAHRRHHHGMGPPPTTNTGGKGLLSAVLEGHSDSASAERSSVLTSPSISTKDSHSRAGGGGGGRGANAAHSSKSNKDTTVRGVGGSFPAPASHSPKQRQRQSPPTVQQIQQRQPQLPTARGKCLTMPSEGVTNDGRDNAEGNLIVFENDAMIVSRKSLHTVSQKTTNILGGGGKSSEFRVLSLLGQGTFAQVFKCLHLPTGSEVAVKVVKNKPAYTRQAAIEIDVFRALQEGSGSGGDPANRSSTPVSQASKSGVPNPDYMVNLLCFFMHRSHLCLVFELLGLNLYELLKKRQFRGLPLSVVQSIILQAVVGVKDLAQKSIVHCDLKPENVLLVSEDVAQDVVRAGDMKRTSKSEMPTPETADSACSDSTGTVQTTNTAESRKRIPSQRGQIKLIDFGSACFEGYTAHTYIQSRFYRSPEVLIGLPYDSAIDMWSLGCVAAELFLGLPILPGVHEHDQLGRITEMIGKVPDWMLDQGSKSTKYYLKYVSRQPNVANEVAPASKPPSPMRSTPSPAISAGSPSPAPSHTLLFWRLKTQKEYIACLSQNEIRKKGGLAKLEKQPGNRYFKWKRLADIITLHAQSTSPEDKELLPAFVHFLYGLLDLDPWKRLTAFQALQHPFLTGDVSQLRVKTADTALDPKEENQANIELDFFWQAPWDPAICRRKLLNVQKIREKQQAARRSMSSRPHGQGHTTGTPRNSVGLQTGTPMEESPGPNRLQPRGGYSPPKEVTGSPSTAASNQSSTPVPLFRRTATQQDYVAASSLNSLGHPGVRVSLARDNATVAGQSIPMPPDLPATAAPRSFTGVDVPSVGDVFQNNGDFANALQRPGVIPGTGTAPSSPGGWSTGPIAQNNSMRMNNIIQRRDFTDSQKIGKSNSHSGGTETPNTQPLTQSSLSDGIPSAHNYPNSYGNQAYNQPFQPMMPNPPLNSNFGGLPSSAASSITMPDASVPLSTNPQHIGLNPAGPYQQPPQVQPFQMMQPQQQPQQQQQMVMQPPAQLQFAAPGQPYMQGQPQQLQMQQPVYLAGAPGGGYYYVTTSAMGQPIVLQPVAIFNQQSDQFGQQSQGNSRDSNMQNYQQAQQQQQQQEGMHQHPRHFAQVPQYSSQGAAAMYPGQFVQANIPPQQQQQQQPGHHSSSRSHHQHHTKPQYM